MQTVNYSEYPEICWYKNGDKKFKDLKVGDSLFAISNYYHDRIIELVVVKPLYRAKKHLYLKYEIKGEGVVRKLDFGETSNPNTLKKYDHSLVGDWIDAVYYTFGTNRGSIIESTREGLEFWLDRYKNEGNLEKQKEIEADILSIQSL